MLALFIFFRLLLVCVFVIAGLAKLGDRARTREDFEALGLPSRIGLILSFCLPFAELGVGALLLIESLANFGAVCALVLLTIFTGVIGVNLWRGRRPNLCVLRFTHARPNWPSHVGPQHLFDGSVRSVIARATSCQHFNSDITRNCTH